MSDFTQHLRGISGQLLSAISNLTSNYLALAQQKWPYSVNGFTGSCYSFVKSRVRITQNGGKSLVFYQFFLHNWSFCKLIQKNIDNRLCQSPSATPLSSIFCIKSSQRGG